MDMQTKSSQEAPKASELLEQSAEPFDRACMIVRGMEQELAAWRSRFPQYEYRPMDDTVSLKLDGKNDARLR